MRSMPCAGIIRVVPGGIAFAVGTRVIRRIFFIIAALSALRLTAQEPARFFIEHINIRDAHRVSPEVVIAESRLREGRGYSEAELREAADRVSRAPYLLSADFSLEKGSERGKYVLVITVNETKPFFYRFELVPIFPHNSGGVHVNLAGSSLATDNTAAFGFRFFLGRRGAIHFGIEGASDNRSYTTDYTSLALGYTQYDLFGTRAFVTLNMKKPFGRGGNSWINSVEPQVVSGIPLSPNQTLTIDYDPTNTTRISQRIASVKWSYNTTNHPLLPTRGTLVTAGPIFVWHDASGFDVVGPTTRSGYTQHDHSFGLEATAERWWELPEQSSIAVGVDAAAARTRLSGFRVQTGLNGNRTVDHALFLVDLNFAHSFWPADRVAKEGESRIELDIRAGPRSEGYQQFVPGRTNQHLRQAALSWVRHNQWGALRLGAGYSW